jgi:hypothetical protein
MGGCRDSVSLVTRPQKENSVKKLTAVLAIGVVALAACGSDDGGSGGGGAGAARDSILSQMTAGGTEGLDQECLEDKIDDLSDSDAVFVAENMDSEEVPADASEGVLEFVAAIFDCVDIDLGDLSE